MTDPQVAALAARWEAEADVIDSPGATYTVYGKAIPLVRRRIAAEVLRRCAAEVRAAGVCVGDDGLRAAAQAVVDVFNQRLGWQPNDLFGPVDALRAALVRPAATPAGIDVEQGIVQRAHVPCCWCGEHHEEGL